MEKNWSINIDLSEHIVLRKWQDIPIAFEFRGFVFNNKLAGRLRLKKARG